LLAYYSFQEFAATDEDEEGISTVSFTDEAQEAFDQWRDELEGGLRTESFHRPLRAIWPSTVH
jgi:hypothetical protein